MKVGVVARSERYAQTLPRNGAYPPPPPNNANSFKKRIHNLLRINESSGIQSYGRKSVEFHRLHHHHNKRPNLGKANSDFGTTVRSDTNLLNFIQNLK
jgi:hypothetical protein